MSQLTDKLERVALWHEKCSAVNAAKAAQAEHQSEEAIAATYQNRKQGHADYARIIRAAIAELIGGPVLTAFDAFWAAYPRKVGKLDARRAWDTHKCGKIIAAVMEGLERCKACADWKKEGGQFIPHPATWIRRGGWDDQPETTAQTPIAARKAADADPTRWREWLESAGHKYTAWAATSGSLSFMREDFWKWERAGK